MIIGTFKNISLNNFVNSILTSLHIKRESVDSNCVASNVLEGRYIENTLDITLDTMVTPLIDGPTFTIV